MGWISIHAEHYKIVRYDGRHTYQAVDVKKELDEEVFKEEDSLDGSIHYKTLKSAMVGSTYYAAIERTVKITGERKVFAIVCLTSFKTKDGEYFNFSFKDMDETMEPFKYDCPISILKLLTPTDNPSANRWREKCRIQHERKKTLSLHFPLIMTAKYPFASGIKPGDKVNLYWHSWPGGRGYYTDGLHIYKLSTILNNDFEVDAKEGDA